MANQRKLGRTADQRKALLRNQVTNLIWNGRIETTEAKAKEVGGHGGMDFIMDYRLVYCLRNGLPLDMDVYDLAEWCCPIELSAISIAHGSAPVAVPDFTRGAWNKIDGYRHAWAE